MEIDDLCKLLSYNPETGEFTWIGSLSARMNGRRAGSVQRNGYRKITVRGVCIYEHRLAFAMMGQTAPPTVDHINRNRADNSWANLRASTAFQNRGNLHHWAVSGVRGVYWEKHCKRWRAQLGVGGGKVRKLGSFVDIAAAKAAYDKAAKEHYGEHYTPG